MIKLTDIQINVGTRTLIQTQGGIILPDGSLTALIGRNGAGKSTLMKAIAGLGPFAGVIEVDGHRPDARSLAFVGTDRTRVPRMTCFDVVAMARAPYTRWDGHLREADRIIVARALTRVGMEDYAGRTMDTMSDGECQRVLVARALAQDTSNILLDEPTSFLDYPSRAELCALLAELAHAGRCVLFSTHEVDTALRFADNVLLLDHRERSLRLLPAPDAPQEIGSVFGMSLKGQEDYF